MLALPRPVNPYLDSPPRPCPSDEPPRAHPDDPGRIPRRHIPSPLAPASTCTTGRPRRAPARLR